MNGRRQLSYRPVGVCSTRIDIVVDGDRIESVLFEGGCNGNTQAVSALVKGMKATEVIARLSGIECKNKGTSCPDQLSKALREVLARL